MGMIIDFGFNSLIPILDDCYLLQLYQCYHSMLIAVWYDLTPVDPSCLNLVGVPVGCDLDFHLDSTVLFV